MIFRIRKEYIRMWDEGIWVDAAEARGHEISRIRNVGYILVATEAVSCGTSAFYCERCHEFFCRYCGPAPVCEPKPHD